MIIRKNRKSNTKSGGGLKWDRFKEKTKKAFTKTKTGTKVGLGATTGSIYGLMKDTFKSPLRLLGRARVGYQSVKLGTSERKLRSKLGFSKGRITRTLDRYETKTQRLQNKIASMQLARKQKIQKLQKKGVDTTAKEEKYTSEMAALQQKLLSKQGKTESYINKQLGKTKLQGVQSAYTEAHSKTGTTAPVSTQDKVNLFRKSIGTVFDAKKAEHNTKLTTEIDKKLGELQSPEKRTLLKTTMETRQGQLEILKQIQGRNPLTKEQMKTHEVFLKGITGKDLPTLGNFSIAELQKINAQIPNAQRLFHDSRNEHKNLETKISKLEKAKNLLLSKKGLGALNQQVMRRQARLNSSLNKYSLLGNTVRTAKAWGGIKSPNNNKKVKSNKNATIALKSVKTDKKTIKGIKGRVVLINPSDPRYITLSNIYNNIDERIGVNKNKLTELETQLKTTINEFDRRTILEDMKKLQDSISKEERNQLRIQQRIPSLKPKVNTALTTTPAPSPR